MVLGLFSPIELINEAVFISNPRYHESTNRYYSKIVNHNLHTSREICQTYHENNGHHICVCVVQKEILSHMMAWLFGSQKFKNIKNKYTHMTIKYTTLNAWF